MTKQVFEDFVAAKTAEPVKNWEKEKADWLGQLKKLHDDIVGWLKPYGEKINQSTRMIPLSEERIGNYQAPMMVITIGNETVKLEPVGTLLIGARGRVDIKGTKNDARLLLVPKNSTGPGVRVASGQTGQIHASFEQSSPTNKWVWKLASFPPVIKYMDLTEESFLDMLMKVVNG